jgi:signal transduction histidine kinase
MLTFYDISQTYKFIHYKSLNNFKSRLIKSISHELRTRLNIIQGMIEIILNQEKHLSVIGC